MESDAVRMHESSQHYALSRMSIVALAVYVVVAAGALIYVRRYAPQHPGTVFLELVGLPALVVLVLIFR